MRSFTQSLRRISSELVLTPKRLEAIAQLDPSHIYVENVRALLGITTKMARFICDLAVRQGVFDKRVEVFSPDHSVVAEVSAAEELPAQVECLEQVNGNYEAKVYDTSRLEKLEFYVLKQGITA